MAIDWVNKVNLHKNYIMFLLVGSLIFLIINPITPLFYYHLIA
jgi:hypothetical protein